jgi:hypothetical protein
VGKNNFVTSSLDLQSRFHFVREYDISDLNGWRVKVLFFRIGVIVTAFVAFCPKAGAQQLWLCNTICWNMQRAAVCFINMSDQKLIDAFHKDQESKRIALGKTIDLASLNNDMQHVCGSDQAAIPTQSTKSVPILGRVTGPVSGFGNAKLGEWAFIQVVPNTSSGGFFPDPKRP